MSRTLVPLVTPDVSNFAKTLKALLDARAASGQPLPTHLELLNLLARGAGWRNYQALRAASVAPPPKAPTPASDLSDLTRKTLAQFDAQGRLTRLPTKRSMQQLAMWALWTRFEARRRYSEKEVNTLLQLWHHFADPATLRREMVGMGLLARLDDCSQYWKLNPKPDATQREFVAAWLAAQGAAPAKPATAA